MRYDAALQEVTEVTSGIASRFSEEASANGFRRLFIRVPVVRALVKSGYSFFNQSEARILNTWDHIWKQTQWYEVAHQAIYYYQHKTITRAELAKIKTWINRCDCWEHSDDLSKIYAQVVEDNPEWIIPLYETWNRARSPWKRRQSIVGLIEYASKRKRLLPFDNLIRFVDPLLNDEDYYVQKGIGWTLREIYNVYPKEGLDYIETNLNRLSAIAYSSATEKLNKALKAKLRSLRQQHRMLQVKEKEPC